MIAIETKGIELYFFANGLTGSAGTQEASLFIIL